MRFLFVFSPLFLLLPACQNSDIALKVNNGNSGSSGNSSINYSGQSTIQLETPYFVNSNPLNSAIAWGAGVTLDNGKFLTSMELFDPAGPSWAQVPTAPSTNSWGENLKKLNNGNVFLSYDGGYSIFNKTTEEWSVPSSLTVNRRSANLELLPNNKVLIIAGTSTSNSKLKSTELYDVQSGTLSPGPDITHGGDTSASMLLDNGKVLIAGAIVSGIAQTTSQLYDYQTNTVTSTGDLNVGRGWFKMIKLDDGKVLAVAGDAYTDSGMTEQCELYDQTTGLWTLTGSLVKGRNYAALGKLRDGRVLIAGGYDQADYSTKLSSVEIYNPLTKTWETSAASLNTARADFPIFFELSNGDVVIASGISPDGWTKTVEIGTNFTEVLTLTSSGGDGNYTYSIQSGPGRIVGDKFYVGVAGVTQIQVADGSGGVGNFSITINAP